MHVHRIYGVKLLESVQCSCQGVQQQRSSTYATKWSLISTKTHPVDALRQTLNPPLHLRAFASQYLPCPFQTQQHDNQPFISVLPISFHPPSPPLCCFACHPNMEALLNDTQISSFAGISRYILTVDIPEEERGKKTHLCLKRSIKRWLFHERLNIYPHYRWS